MRVLYLGAAVVCMTLFGDINHGRPNSKKTPKISTPNAYTLSIPMSRDEIVDFSCDLVMLNDKDEGILQT